MNVYIYIHILCTSTLAVDSGLLCLYHSRISQWLGHLHWAICQTSGKLHITPRGRKYHFFMGNNIHTKKYYKIISMGHTESKPPMFGDLSETRCHPMFPSNVSNVSTPSIDPDRPHIPLKLYPRFRLGPSWPSMCSMCNLWDTHI